MAWFIADRRYIVGGRLAAYEGERMTEQEAERRGIRHETAIPPCSTKAQLVEMCARRGITVPARATKAQLERLLEA